MKKLFAILALATCLTAILGANDFPPPECAPTCPWVK
jgi:hypothetical protein